MVVETDPAQGPGVVLDNLGINGARYGTALAWNEQAWAEAVKRRPPPELFVFESEERAKARGARIYCEVKGFGMTDDANHIAAPLPTGEMAALAMQAATEVGGLALTDVDYVNAHGTSTPVGDVAETKGIKSVFGADTKLAVSSTKSMIGHLLGAAGSVEAIITIKSLQDQILPPTINLHDPSPDCDLDYVPNIAREAGIQAAATNSFGFGGTNGTLIFGTV